MIFNIKTNMLTTGKIANPYFNCYFAGAGKIATAL